MTSHSPDASEPTLYEVLMVHPAADADVITTVYRELAKRHHPDRDRSPGAAMRMAELNDAYATLHDPGERARYDEVLGVPIVGLAPDANGMGSALGAVKVSFVDSAWTARPDEPEGAIQYGEAGPPLSSPRASGQVLAYGRYRGWAINQVASHDRTYIEWLRGIPAGRAYRDELDAVLGDAS
ncbi:hypothetical protein BH24CHL9_BH24CHL9_15260 [soil metagenome]